MTLDSSTRRYQSTEPTPSCSGDTLVDTRGDTLADSSTATRTSSGAMSQGDSQGDYVSPMIHPWHDLSPGPKPPEQITAVIEIPTGSRNKYELDKDTGLFKLDRVLYSAVSYPGEYGLVPRTLHEDGDPLDILVHVEEATFAGCQIESRPIGVLKMLDRGEPDDKIFAVPVHDPRYTEYYDIKDFPQHYLKEIEHFFLIYKDLEGRRVEIRGWEGSDSAKAVIQSSIARYEQKYMRVGP